MPCQKGLNQSSDGVYKVQLQFYCKNVAWDQTVYNPIMQKKKKKEKKKKFETL